MNDIQTLIESIVATELADAKASDVTSDAALAFAIKRQLDRAFSTNIAIGMLLGPIDIELVTDYVAKHGAPRDANTSTLREQHIPSTQPQHASPPAGTPTGFARPEAPHAAAASATGASVVATEQSRECLPNTLDLFETLSREGWQLGAQLFVSHKHKTLADVAIGKVNETADMTINTALPWLCSSKPVIAMAFLRLVEQHCIALDSKVIEIIPEFSRNDSRKAAITFRHLLTHTASLRPDPAYPHIYQSRQYIFDAICDAPLPQDAMPGLEAYYSGVSSWFLLGIAIERLDGASRSLNEIVRDDIFQPLRATHSFLQLDSDQFDHERHALGPLFSGNPHSKTGIFPLFASKEQYNAFLPGLLAFGPAHDLGHVVEGLLPTTHCNVLSSLSRDVMTAAHRVGMYDAHWKGFHTQGLGVIVGSGWHGSYCSPRTFGYRGTRSSAIVGDPANEIVVVYIQNTMSESAGRERALVECVYRDLGLDHNNALGRVSATTPFVTPNWIHLADNENTFWEQ